MQEWFDDNNILMHSTHNKGKSVIAESYMKRLQSVNKITANDSKSYLIYWNKSEDQCQNTYHYSINKMPLNPVYSALTEKMRPILKLLCWKLMKDSELLSIRLFLVKISLKISI